MKTRNVLLILLCVGIVMPCLSSCTKKKNKYAAHSFDYFDTVTTVTGYAETEEAFHAVCAEIFDLLEEYHQLFNIYERYEGIVNLRTVNDVKNGVHSTVKVDRKIIDLLLYAKEMHQKTDGNINIAMGSVLSVWHEYREAGISEPWNAALPPADVLEKAAAHTDIEGILIDEENETVTLTDPDMRLDVGAIAKGYAVEMAAQYLESKKIDGYVINVGGNVRAVGAKADGSEWLVGIENPEESADLPYTEYLNLADASIVTSGSYQRYYVVDGKRYHHIIDPKTLLPADYYLSVSVICKDSAEGDALSTALFCMPFEEGLALAESLEGVEAMWIFPNGEKRYSDGFAEYRARN